MNRTRILILILLSFFLLFSCEKNEDVSKDIYNVSLENVDAKGNYSFGRLLAEDADSNGITVSGGYFAKGVYDSQTPDALMFSVEEMNEILGEYQKEVIASGKKGEVGKEYQNREEIEKLDKPSNLQDKLSYVWGYANSPEMYTGSIGVDIDAFVAGYLSYLYGKESLLSEEEIEDSFTSWQNEINEIYQEEYAKRAEKNLEDAKAFLEKNKKKDGVIVFDSGLQLEKTVEVEEGGTPEPDDEIVVDYRLSLLDGSVADQGNDVTFKANSLIPGFVEAVENMKVGESAIAYIHPDLGYGSSDLGNIGPNSLLIFEITLKGIK